MSDSLTKRLVLLGGSVVTIAGLYQFPGDIAELFRDAIDTLTNEPVATALVLIGVTIVGFGFRDEISSWLGIKSDARLRRMVTNWLHEKRDYALNLTDTKSDPWVLVASTENFTVQVQKDRKASSLTLITGRKVSDDHRAILARGSSTVREELWEDVAIELTKMGVELKVERDSESEVLKTIDMITGIPIDSGLDERAFMEQVGLLMRSSVCANHLIRRAVRKARTETATQSATTPPTPTQPTSGEERVSTPEEHPGK